MNIGNAQEKVSNESMNIGNAQEKVSNEFDEFVPLLRNADIKERFIYNIRMVYGHCGTDQTFGQANVMEWLDCSKLKAKWHKMQPGRELSQVQQEYLVDVIMTWIQKELDQHR